MPAPLKAYIDCNPRFGKAIHRVVEALELYRPAGVEITADRAKADHVVHHVVGVGNFEEQPINQLVAMSPGTYSVIQYCFATTEIPDLVWWTRNVWDLASAVWSYYDLDSWCRRELESGIANFLRLPLGADPNIFHNHGRADRPHYVLLTSGYVAGTETVVECAEACRRVGKQMLHLGPLLPELVDDVEAEVVTCISGLSDTELANAYRTSSYVAALRKGEGFELPGIEGMLCGARPITYDLECYTHWYDKSARYIRHASTTEEQIDQLAEILITPPRPLGTVELGLAQRTFSWPRVVGTFWQKVLQGETT